MGALVQVVVSLALALAIGWAGGRVFAPAPPAASAVGTEAPVLDADALPGVEAVVELPTITTNLAGPETAWARLELALVFAEHPDAAMANRVHADALAYLRTLSVRQIASPSGFAFLRSDLASRAADLTGGAVEDVLVRTFLVE